MPTAQPTLDATVVMTTDQQQRACCALVARETLAARPFTNSGNPHAYEVRELAQWLFDGTHPPESVESETLEAVGDDRIDKITEMLHDLGERLNLTGQDVPWKDRPEPAMNIKRPRSFIDMAAADEQPTLPFPDDEDYQSPEDREDPSTVEETTPPETMTPEPETESK